MTARDINLVQVGGGWWQVRERGVRVMFSTRSYPAAVSKARRAIKVARILDEHLPLLGPCRLCCAGNLDQSHRLIDALAGRVRAGDDPAETGGDYGLGVEVVKACVWWTAQDTKPLRRRATA